MIIVGRWIISPGAGKRYGVRIYRRGRLEGTELEVNGLPFSSRREAAVCLQRRGRVEVLVVEADEERARELLALAEAGELRLDEDSEEE